MFEYMYIIKKMEIVYCLLFGGVKKKTMSDLWAHIDFTCYFDTNLSLSVLA